MNMKVTTGEVFSMKRTSMVLWEHILGRMWLREGILLVLILSFRLKPSTHTLVPRAHNTAAPHTVWVVLAFRVSHVCTPSTPVRLLCQKVWGTSLVQLPECGIKNIRPRHKWAWHTDAAGVCLLLTVSWLASRGFSWQSWQPIKII